MSPRRKGGAAPLLTTEQLAALLSEYVANEVPITALVRRWGVSAAYINCARRAAGLSGRAVVNRFETLKVVDVEAHMLPVFPVRLVGRPAVPSAPGTFTRSDGRSGNGYICALCGGMWVDHIAPGSLCPEEVPDAR